MANMHNPSTVIRIYSKRNTVGIENVGLKNLTSVGGSVGWCAWVQSSVFSFFLLQTVHSESNIRSYVYVFHVFENKVCFVMHVFSTGESNYSVYY